MTGVLNLGPATIAVERAVAVALIWLFLAIGSHRSFGPCGSRVTWIAAAAGILAARLGFVIENVEAFRVEPVSALYVWQGGFSPGWGIATAAGVLLFMQRGRDRVRWLALLAALGSLGLVAQIAALPREATAFPRQVALSHLNGQPFDISGRSGGPFVVNLWASWCPPCRREMPMLAQVAANSPVPILLVNQGEEAATVASFGHELGLGRTPFLLDRASALSSLAQGALPATLFVDGNGIIKAVHFGEISRAALLIEIRKLSENEQ